MRVETFRVHKETIKARYTAAEGSERVREAFTSMDADTSDLADPGAEAGSGIAGASAEAGELLREIEDFTPSPRGGPGPADEDDIEPPPGLMELRPGAPDGARAGLLFAVDPPGTAVLLGWAEDPGGSAGSYREVLQTAAGRNQAAVTVLRRPVAHEPLNETAHRELMSSWARLGETARAVRHYEELTALLRDQVGVPPAPETTALYRNLSTGG